MKIAGIIAEFNPFHAGHKYLIEKTREELNTDAVVTVMSGNFVQRGEPAIFDMGFRAETALKNGADIVFELPPKVSLSSAEGFASGAVELLVKLGADCLVFGSECGDMDTLSGLADLLTDESPEYKEALAAGLKQGLSFPAAREKAVLACVTSGNSAAENLPDAGILHEILHNPNDILALEYLKAIKKSAANIIPYTVKRAISPYHSSDDPGTDIENAMYSAEAIRRLIFKGSLKNTAAYADPLLKEIRDIAENFGTVDRDAVSGLLLYKLLSDGLDASLDKALVPIDLKKRILNNRDFDGSFSDFCALLKTKNITYTAVSRYLLRLLLDMDLTHTLAECGYIRLLGFRKKSEEALSALSRRSLIPILSNSSDIRAYLKENPDDLSLREHLRVDRSYNTFRSMEKRRSHPLPPELSRRILII